MHLSHMAGEHTPGPMSCHAERPKHLPHVCWCVARGAPYLNFGINDVGERGVLHNLRVLVELSWLAMSP